MAANYPASLPVKDAAGANLSTNPHSTLHDDMYDEIVAIGTELGTNPKGTSASVKARLDTMSTKLNGIKTGTTTGTTSAGGDLTITFGVTYAVAPVVLVFPYVAGATAQISVHHTAVPTTTQQVVRVTSNNAVLASTSIQLRWVAIGTLA